MKPLGWQLFILASLLVTNLPAAQAPALFAPSLSDSDGYNETFTFNIDFPDGGFAQAQLGVTNMGPGSGRALCRLWVNHAGLQWRAQTVAGGSEWAYEKSPRARLQIGKCHVRDDVRPALVAATEKGELRLTLHEDLNVRTPIGSRAEREGAEFEARVFGMAVTATAELKTLDGKTLRAPVRVWVEHNRGTHSPDTFAKRWIRIRTVDEGPPMTALVRVGEAGKADGWLLHGNGESNAFNVLPATVPLGGTDHFAPLLEMGFLGRVLGAVVGQVELDSSLAAWTHQGQKRRVRLDTTTFR